MLYFWQKDMTWVMNDSSSADSLDCKIIPLKSVSTNILTVSLSCHWKYLLHMYLLLFYIFVNDSSLLTLASLSRT